MLRALGYFLLRNTRCRFEFETKDASTLFENRYLALLRTLLHHGKDTLIVALPSGDEVVQDSGNFVGRGCNRRRSAESRSGAAKVVAEIGATSVQRVSRQSEGDRKSTHHVTRANGKNLPSADPVVRTEAEPRGESGSAGEFRKICADFRQQQVCSQATDTRYVRKIDPKDTI